MSEPQPAPGDLDEIECPKCHGSGGTGVHGGECSRCGGEGTICGQCNLSHPDCKCDDWDDEDDDWGDGWDSEEEAPREYKGEGET